MGLLHSAFRIVWHALVFRVRRRELNNLPASISLMLAFRLPASEVFYRGTFAVLLNAFVYLLNDFCDIDLDLTSPDKDPAKAQFLADNRPAGMVALGGLASLLIAGGIVHSPLLVTCALANGFIIAAYSLWLKRVAVLDVLSMVAWGAAMCAVAAPGGLLGWQMIGLLALLCACYEVIQLVRDLPHDRTAGVRSTAVLLGSHAAWVFRGLLVLTSGYGLVWLGSLAPCLLLVATPLPLRPESANRTWDWTRLIFAVTWLALLAQVHLVSRLIY